MNTQNSERPPVPKHQLYTGIAILVLGQLGPLLVPLVYYLNLSKHWTVALSGFLLIGIPEISLVAAAIVLGKDGFQYIKSVIFGWVGRLAPAEKVSRRRYRVGLVLFLIPILFAFMTPYFMMMIPGYFKNAATYGLSGDLILLVSLFVLGGEFFDKLRSLFIYDSRAEFS
jgi:hypothetical protein